MKFFAPTVSEEHYSKDGGPARYGPARYVPSLTVNGGKPGKFKYTVRTVNGVDHVGGMNYVCFGCKTVGHLPFRSPLWPKLQNDWEWDGNHEKPTLSPSIHHIGCWHGHLRDGVFKSC